LAYSAAWGRDRSSSGLVGFEPVDISLTVDKLWITKDPARDSGIDRLVDGLARDCYTTCIVIRRSDDAHSFCSTSTRVWRRRGGVL